MGEVLVPATGELYVAICVVEMSTLPSEPLITLALMPTVLQTLITAVEEVVKKVCHRGSSTAQNPAGTSKFPPPLSSDPMWKPVCHSSLPSMCVPKIVTRTCELA